MKLGKTIIAGFLALLMILSPLVQNVDAAGNDGSISLQYRYGTNNLIQVNTNLPSDTPLVNFTADQNGCSIDQSGNTVQWVGWIGMDNVDGTVVLTFHFNSAFTAGQSYVLPKGAVFGFTDGKTYALDGDYTFTFDGSSWSMNVENVDEPEPTIGSLSFQYRWGAGNVIQVNTNLPSDTPIKDFLTSDNGCEIDESGNQYKNVAWISMANAGGTIVLTFNFGSNFEAGQTYFLPAGAIFGFTDGNKYALDKDYTFLYDGSAWSIVEPVKNISLSYRYGTNNLIQYNTDLPASTPIANFLASDNGSNLIQSGDQQVGWIEMANANDTIVLTFHFNNAFAVAQSYTLAADSVFGFTDGNSYVQASGITLYWDGAAWTDTQPHVHSYDAVVTPPTATKEGFTTHTCSGCGDSYVDSTVPAVGIGELKFKSAALVLENNLTIKFYADGNLFIEDAYTAPYAVFTVGKKTQKVTEYQIIDGNYVFACTNIAPSQMGDTVYASLCADLNGEACTSSMEYGVANYCYGMLAKTDNAKLRTLLVDLLNYGAAAQKYAWYNDKTPCNAALTEEQKAWGTNEDPVLGSVLNTKYATVENAKATWKAAMLVLENAVTMRFRFAAESTEGLSVKVEMGGQTYTITSFEADPDNAGQYYATFNGTVARQMRETVLVTVYEGDTAVSNTLSYSIESYACGMQNVARVGELVKAMMKYGDSAAAYLN